MINWDSTKVVFLKTINEMIRTKMITVNEIYSLEGVASIFANDLYTFVREEEKREELSVFFNTMQKYFPDKFNEFIEKSKAESKTEI